MRKPVAIENIDELRRQQGITDWELYEEIQGLQVGDHIKLTLLTGTTPVASETVRVRITRIRDRLFRGRLVQRPTAAGLSQLQEGSFLNFTAAHIHSIPKGQPSHEQ
jgi:hypothetical protein